MDSRRALRIAALAYVLGLAAQATFVFYLIPAFARAHAAAAFEAWAFGASAIVTAAVAIPAGRASDRFGRRPVMRWGYGFVGAGALALLAAPSLPAGPVLVAGALLVAAGFATFFVAVTSYIGDLSRKGGFAGAYGTVNAIALLASGATPFAAAGLVALAGEPARGTAWSAALVGALATVAAFLTYALPTARGGAALVDVEPTRALDARAGRSRVLRVCVTFAVMGAGYGMAHPYVGAFLLDHAGATTAALGVIVGLATLANAVGYLAGGRLARELPERALLYGVNLALLASALLLLAPMGLALLAVALAARAFFAALAHPHLNAIAAEAVPARERGRALGVTVVAWNLGWAAGAFAGGPAVARYGAWIFVAGALLALASVLAVTLDRRVAIAEEPRAVALAPGARR